MRIAIFCRWMLGLALLELGLARPCSAQAQSDAGPGEEVPAPAQPRTDKPLELTWLSADPNCEGTAVASRALELVTPGVTPRPTQARAELSRDGNSWVVDLQTSSESHAGRRVLRGESCKEIQQAIALLLAMILESEAQSDASQAAPSTPSTPPPRSAAPNTMLAPIQDFGPEPEPPPPSTPGPALGWLVRSDATAALGLKPGLALGVGLGAALSLGAAELAAGATYWPASRADIFDGSGTLEVTRQNLTLAGCYRFSTGAVLQIVPCLGPELTWYRWHSEGIDNVDGTKLLVSLTGSIEFRFALVGPMFAALTPGVTGELKQPFGVRKDCTDCAGTGVFHTWGIGPRFGAGVGARF